MLVLPDQEPVTAQSSPTQAPRTGLVVLIAIDQFRPDYFTRWPGQLQGGLARLRSQSVLFPNAEQDHALTETAPGHSTMLSGRYPAHTGIYANDPGIWDPMVRLIGVTGLDKDGKQRGSSPRRFVGTVLFDWMHRVDPQARALSVSRKDRGAIPPLGRAKQTILWYAAGQFTTSRTYGDTLPTWLRDWNDKLNLNSWAGRPWPLLLPDSAYREVDDAPWENAGNERTFPHALTTDLNKLPDALEDYPWMDSLTLDVAWKGVRQLRLGQRSNGTDLLSISLSTTDAIGHKWGPDSRELHDHILRIDRWLGTFLDSLERVSPRERTIIVVTADHGVSPMPEKLASEGKPAGRINLKPFADSVAKKLAAQWGADFGISVDNGLLLGDGASFRVRGINFDSVAEALAAHLRTIRGVRRVFTPRTLAAAPQLIAKRNCGDTRYPRR
jgi:predicted AlkP superfamily pyrophosphatase or phosphodiesterase